MSRSPSASPSKRELEDYLAGWGATLDLVKQGRSWSGNERNCAYLNCADGPFANVSVSTGLDFPDDGRGLALTDWDADGDLDLWLRNRTSPRLRLMINRSDRSGGPDSVALRLRGVHCNRDAIGARVEVHLAGEGHAPLVQTSYAGDGFLSQSSKWLHFGLGEGREIERVVVAWPGGEREQFRGLAPGGRYLLEQGSGSGRTQPTSQRESALRPGDHEPWKPTDVASVFLPARFPMPVARYSTYAGETRTFEPPGGPSLITFWASWCAPCLGELDALAQAKRKLDKAGLKVLALTVDGLDEAMETTPADARAHLERTGFPFPSAVASTELLEKLELVQRFYFDRVPAFAVPTSFLIDSQGQLAAVYRGTFELDVLLDHVKQLDRPEGDYWDIAAPFPGRWLLRLGGVRMNMIADLFRERFPQDAARYSQLAIAELDVMSAAGSAVAQDRNTRADAQCSLGRDFAAEGKWAEAVVHYRAALELVPNHFQAHSNIAMALKAQRKTAEAIQHLHRAAEIQPDDPTVHFNLAQALRQAGENERAVSSFRAALTLDPTYGRAHFVLSDLLQTNGDTRGAIVHLREAVRLEPEWPQPMDSLAWILSTSKQAELRAGFEAVQLAERAAQLTGQQDATILATLAAAYAETGQFARAVPMAEQALRLAREEGNQQAVGAFAQFLERYKRGEPVRY